MMGIAQAQPEVTKITIATAAASNFAAGYYAITQSIRGAVHVRTVEREAQRAGRRLAEAQERYRFLAESIPQMVL